MTFSVDTCVNAITPWHIYVQREDTGIHPPKQPLIRHITVHAGKCLRFVYTAPIPRQVTQT